MWTTKETPSLDLPSEALSLPSPWPSVPFLAPSSILLLVCLPSWLLCIQRVFQSTLGSTLSLPLLLLDVVLLVCTYCLAFVAIIILSLVFRFISPKDHAPADVLMKGPVEAPLDHKLNPKKRGDGLTPSMSRKPDLTPNTSRKGDHEVKYQPLN